MKIVNQESQGSAAPAEAVRHVRGVCVSHVTSPCRGTINRTPEPKPRGGMARNIGAALLRHLSWQIPFSNREIQLLESRLSPAKRAFATRSNREFSQVRTFRHAFALPKSVCRARAFVDGFSSHSPLVTSHAEFSRP